MIHRKALNITVPSAAALATKMTALEIVRVLKLHVDTTDTAETAVVFSIKNGAGTTLWTSDAVGAEASITFWPTAEDAPGRALLVEGGVSLVITGASATLNDVFPCTMIFES